jgi:hypothetical protein
MFFLNVGITGIVGVGVEMIIVDVNSNIPAIEVGFMSTGFSRTLQLINEGYMIASDNHLDILIIG